MKNFGDWLQDELKNRNISQKDLADMSHITPAQISRIISGSRGAGEQALIAIAHALKLPSETVFRAAGLLPPISPENELIKRITHITSQLPEDEQNDILQFVLLRQRISKERKKNAVNTKTPPKSVTP